MGPGSICPSKALTCSPLFMPLEDFLYKAAPERGGLRERSIFSKGSGATTAAHHLQGRVRASTKAQTKRVWGQWDLRADCAGRIHGSWVQGSRGEAGASR